jgi:hypothetical protein
LTLTLRALRDNIKRGNKQTKQPPVPSGREKEFLLLSGAIFASAALVHVKIIKKRSESAQIATAAESVEDLGTARAERPTNGGVVAARHNQNNLLRALLKGKVSDQ